MSEKVMPTDLSTLTNTELLVRIVEAEKDCDLCEGSKVILVGEPDQDDCWECEGIGKVPILSPELMRLPCPCPSYCVRYHDMPDDRDDRRCGPCGSHASFSMWDSSPLGKHGDWCENCQGRGWGTNDDPWAMKKSLRLAGFYLVEDCVLLKSMETPWFASCWRCVEDQGDSLSPSTSFWDADPERARLLAVAKALTGIADARRIS